MDEFKPGDKVEVIDEGGGHRHPLGSQATVKAKESGLVYLYFDDGKSGAVLPGRIKLIKGTDKNMSATQSLKNLELTAEDRLLRKYYIVDSTDSLTGEGNNFILRFLLTENKAAIVKKLREVEALDKANPSTTEDM